jgi:hypothetical protein
MLSLGHLDHLGGDRVKRLLEEDIHAIEDDLHDILGPLDGSNFSDIGLLDGLDGVLGLLEIWQGSLQLLVSLISFELDLLALCLASLGDGIDFLGFDVSLLVLLIEFFEKFVCCLGGSIELSILFLENDLHLLDI